MGKEELIIDNGQLIMDWKCQKLKNIVTIIGGGTPSKSNKNYYKGSIPWASVRDLNDHYLLDTEFKITETAIENSSTNIIPKGNIIIATRVGLGKVVYNEIDTAINQDLKGLILTDKVERNYLFYYFLWNAKLIEDSGTGATVKGVKLSFIKELSVPLPPFPEQRRIVSKLDALFAEIDASLALIDQNIKQAEALKLSVLDEEINYRDFGKVPFLKFIAERKEKLKPEPKKTYNIIGLENIESYSGKLIDFKPLKGEESRSNKAVFKKGDILYSKLRPYLNKVLIADFDGIATTEIIPFIADSEKYTNEFVGYFLRSESIVQKINLSCSGARMPRTKKSFWKTLDIPFPSIKTQQKIVQKLDALFDEIDGLVKDYTQKRENLEALKSSLLDRAFKGEL